MRSRPLIENAALFVGLTFLLVGILGFIPGITTHYGDMTFASHDSDAKLLGIFEVSVLHNVVHILFGLAALALYRTVSGAQLFLVGGGLIYVALFAYGIVVDKDSSANFIPVNSADDVLHLVLGLAMVAIGFLATRVESTMHRQAA